jgi:putative membrane protein
MQSGRMAGVLMVLAGMMFIIGFLFVDPDPRYSAVSGLFILLLALPSFGVLIRWLGLRRGLSILGVFSLLPLFIEAVAVVTGYPYGHFSYSTAIGPVLFGIVPVAVAFAYLPVLLGGISLSCQGSGITLTRAVLISTGFVLLADLVIDPAAVHAGFWMWENPGLYYGIPISNFLGWALTGLIYSWLFFTLTSKQERPFSCPPAMMAASLLLIMAIWSGYLFRHQLLIPAVLGLMYAILVGFFILTTREP